MRMQKENKLLSDIKTLYFDFVNRLDLKMSDLINFNQIGIIEPNLRIQQLVKSGSNVNVDPNQPVLR